MGNTHPGREVRGVLTFSSRVCVRYRPLPCLIARRNDLTVPVSLAAAQISNTWRLLVDRAQRVPAEDQMEELVFVPGAIHS